jgi:hypothetical protein
MMNMEPLTSAARSGSEKGRQAFPLSFVETCSFEHPEKLRRDVLGSEEVGSDFKESHRDVDRFGIVASESNQCGEVAARKRERIEPGLELVTSTRPFDLLGRALFTRNSRNTPS